MDKRTMIDQPIDFDNAWKEALEGYFTEFMSFFFPDAYNDIVWENGYEFSEVNFKFPIVKLIDYREQWEMLEKSDNLFAIAVMTHLKTQETRNDSERRKLWKFQLIKGLYEREYKREDIVKLFKFIDWIMQLPKELENELWKEISEYKEEKKMQYITSVERIGIEKGIKQGIEQGREEGREEGIREGLLAGIETMLEFRFGGEGLRLLPEISKIDDSDVLRAINAALKTVKNLDELRHIYL